MPLQDSQIDKSRVKLNLKSKPYQIALNLNFYHVSIPEISLSKIDSNKLKDDEKQVNPIFKLVNKILCQDSENDNKENMFAKLNGASTSSRNKIFASKALYNNLHKYSIQSLLSIYKELNDFSNNWLNQDSVEINYMLKVMISKKKQNLKYDMHHLLTSLSNPSSIFLEELDAELKRNSQMFE